VLREITGVKQERGPGRRRWFESDGLDLIVWLARDATITGFQVCYDFGDGEHALTWRSDAGFAHNKIDSGDQTPLANLTPVLERDAAGGVPWERIVQRFEQRSATLEPAIRELVSTRLASGGARS
jgi:hypothetical protein